MKCSFEIIADKGKYIITEGNGWNFFDNGLLSLNDLPTLDFMEDKNDHLELMEELNKFLNSKSIDLYNDTYSLCYQSFNDNTFPKFVYNFTRLKYISMSGGRMWSLRISNTPKTVEYLDIRYCDNLSDSFFDFLETNVKKLCVDIKDIYSDIIPVNTNLEQIEIYINDNLSSYYFEDEDEDEGEDFLLFIKDLHCISEEVISINICDNNQDNYYFSYSDLFNYKISPENLPLFENLKEGYLGGLYIINITFVSKIKKYIEIFTYLINHKIIDIDIASIILSYIFDFGENSISIGKYFINMYMSNDKNYKHSLYNSDIEKQNRNKYICENIYMYLKNFL